MKGKLIEIESIDSWKDDWFDIHIAFPSGKTHLVRRYRKDTDINEMKEIMEGWCYRKNVEDGHIKPEKKESEKKVGKKVRKITRNEIYQRRLRNMSLDH